MDFEDVENTQTSTEACPPSPTTVTKEEILKGDVNIPVKETFAFVIDHITETFGKRMGVGSVIDRNFLYFQQLGLRKRIEKLDKYTFLHPLVTDNVGKIPTLVSIEPHSKCKNEMGVETPKEAFVIYILSPKMDEEPGTQGLNELNSFFQKEVREHSNMSQENIEFGHLLQSILECHDHGYIHFTIEGESPTSPTGKWAFEYYQNELLVYQISHEAPFESHEMSSLSPWISSTKAYFQRVVPSSYRFRFTEEEIELIRNDPEVKLLQSKSVKDQKMEEADTV
jgi:hypothetical protein